MITLSQRDPAWAQQKIGQSNLTIGRYGCTTTAISMLSDYFKCYKNPVEIQKYVNYTPDGLILWSTFHLGPMHFEKRLYGRHDDEILASLKDPKKAVILEVDHCHWVTATGKVPLINLYMIADPWTGTRRLSSAYKEITGSAHFYYQA